MSGVRGLGVEEVFVLEVWIGVATHARSYYSFWREKNAPFWLPSSLPETGNRPFRRRLSLSCP